MKLATPPKIDARSSREVVTEVEHGLGLRPELGDFLANAIVQVFGRYCEILIDRLNRVPEVHHLFFLNLLGASPVPAVPARTSLTFKAVDRPGELSEPVRVPPYTQVATLQGTNDSEPVVFETTMDLELVRAEVVQAIFVDTQRHLYTDVSAIVSAGGLTGRSMFTLERSVERAAHLAQGEIFGLPDLIEVRVRVEVVGAASFPANSEIEWGIPAPTGFIALHPVTDTTCGLTRTGEVVFRHPPEWPTREIFGTESNWLTCRVHTRAGSPLTQDSSTADTLHSARVTGIWISGTRGAEATAIESAFFGSIPLDPTRDFFPLGERPRFGDVFYVQSEAFAVPGARVVIDIRLTNPFDAERPPIAPVSREGKPRLRLEIWTNRGWVVVDCDDGTRSFRRHGQIFFTVPEGASHTAVNGVDGGWMRVRLISGNYAVGPRPAPRESGLIVHEEQAPPWDSELIVRMAPPAIASMTVTLSAELGPMIPERVVVESNLEYFAVDVAAGQTFQPYPAADVRGLAVYLGLRAPSNRELADHRMSFYVSVADPPGRAMYPDSPNRDGLPPRWQVRGRDSWGNCDVEDATRGMREPGPIHVRLGDDVSKWRGSTLNPELFWLRIVWHIAERDQPSIRRLMLNTVPAIQAITLENELLGSSNGKPNQVFQAARVPIIGDVALEVREPDVSAEDDLGMPSGELGRAAIGPVEAGRVPVRETWVSWYRVDDFSMSDQQSRHYVLDRLTGSISFGDGRRGLIPPSGANNVRLAEYRTGGGDRGNRPPNTITQLRTTVPYVESVTNWEPASGGQDTEDADKFRHSAGPWIRHRDRAVCADDFEDLAKRASPLVVKAKCIKARDLAHELPSRELGTGAVGLIVVPHSPDPCPRPTRELLMQVKEFLDDRRPVGSDLVVLAPEYVSLSVKADVVVTATRLGAGAALECERRLAEFLHPVTGGIDGHGWGFGEQPHDSDFYPLLEAVPGVDYIRSLRIAIEEERPGLLASGTFLVCPGTGNVNRVAGLKAKSSHAGAYS